MHVGPTRGARIASTRLLQVECINMIIRSTVLYEVTMTIWHWIQMQGQGRTIVYVDPSRIVRSLLTTLSIISAGVAGRDRIQE
jgi:hypothetical protein